MSAGRKKNRTSPRSTYRNQFMSGSLKKSTKTGQKPMLHSRRGQK